MVVRNHIYNPFFDVGAERDKKVPLFLAWFSSLFGIVIAYGMTFLHPSHQVGMFLNLN